MLIYILNSSACLAILLVFYKLLLESASIHHFKRYFLLSALIVSLIIPSLTFVTYVDPVLIDLEPLKTDHSIKLTKSAPQYFLLDNLPIILWSIYSIGVFVFLLKFCFNLNRIFSRIRNNPKHKSDLFINVLVNHLRIPHTFLNYIFLNKNKFEQNEIPPEVLLHEQTHAKQKHSIDILVIEIIQILFWFNPLIYFLKKQIKLNHEFLADHAVINSGIQPKYYQTLLLAFSSTASHQQLTNAINYSSIKKRFTIMKTQTSKRSIWFRTILLLPLLAILLYSFTQTEDIIKGSDTDASVSKSSINSNGVSDKLMTEYTSFMSTYNDSNTIKALEYERAVSIYNMMSNAQQASVNKYPELPYFNGSKTNGKVPSKQEFESWKNANKYALWLDGEAIPNSTLNKYTVDDIAYYSGSFVHNNARSKTFPQAYQFRLYTAKGFADSFQLSKVKDYNLLAQHYTDEIQQFLKGNQLDNSELKLLKEQIDRIYINFSKEEIKQHNILQAPPVPAQKNPQQATAIQVAEYNKLAKYYNDNLDRKNITIKMKDVERLKYLYGLMSTSQRKNAEPFPDFPKPPPPPPAPAPVSIEVVEIKDVPPPPPIPENATLEEKEKYKKAMKDYKTKKQAKIKRYKNNKGELKEIIVIPDAPDVPPPPPPRLPLDFVIDMAKKNANFYYEGKKVSSDKAIELVKNNKELNIKSKNSNENQPDIYITQDPIVIKKRTKKN